MHNSIPFPASTDGHGPQEDPYQVYAGEESLPFTGPLTVRSLDHPANESDRLETEECDACQAQDEEYVWVSDRWRVRTTSRPTGLPVVLGLECRPHLDLGDLPNLLAAELGVMTVRLEKAIRSLSGVDQVQVQRWGDGGHLRVWFLAQPSGRRELRGPYLPVWDRVLPPEPEAEWRNHLGTVAAWLADYGGRAVVDPPRLEWQALPELSVVESPPVSGAGEAAG